MAMFVEFFIAGKIFSIFSIERNINLAFVACILNS